MILSSVLLNRKQLAPPAQQPCQVSRSWLHLCIFLNLFDLLSWPPTSVWSPHPSVFLLPPFPSMSSSSPTCSSEEAFLLLPPPFCNFTTLKSIVLDGARGAKMKTWSDLISIRRNLISLLRSIGCPATA